MKLLLILFCLGMILSCKKAENNAALLIPPVIEYNGVVYDLDILKSKMEILIGVEKDRLSFDYDNLTFKMDRYDIEYKLEEVIDELNKITL